MPESQPTNELVHICSYSVKDQIIDLIQDIDKKLHFSQVIRYRFMLSIKIQEFFWDFFRVEDQSMVE